ncbi:MAG: hypothetical protein ABI960_10035 [Candidatus Eisenbacteria bacterium]
MAPHTIKINRAPVLTLWATIVAQRLGHTRPEALTLGKAVAGLNAQSKGQRLGIYAKPAAKGKSAKKAREEHAGKARPTAVSLMGRHILVCHTKDGMSALIKEKPIEPASVEKYIAQKFGDDLDAVTAVFRALAKSRKPAELAESAYALYESFRPEIPAGTRGWGAKGVLDLAAIRALAAKGGG